MPDPPGLGVLRRGGARCRQGPAAAGGIRVGGDEERRSRVLALPQDGRGGRHEGGAGKV